MATNIVGDSYVSTVDNTAIIITFPDPPVNLENDEVTTSATTIRMTWDEAAFNGGSTVIDYQVRYRETGSVTDYNFLASGITDTDYQTSDLSQGSSYDFVVEARNSRGLSQIPSDPVTIL
jgi:titin